MVAAAGRHSVMGADHRRAPSMIEKKGQSQGVHSSGASIANQVTKRRIREEGAGIWQMRASFFLGNDLCTSEENLLCLSGNERY